MYFTTYLQWFHEGAWHQIGWPATNPEKTRDLREHGRLMAAGGGQYRLVQPSVYRDQPMEVIHEYPVLAVA